MKKRYQLFTLLLLMITGFVSCIDTKKSTYFNGAADTSFIQAPGANENIIQNNDILSIAISSLNADASAVFNTANNFVISSSSASGINSQSIGYLVNAEGNIQLPILGNVRAAGLTKEELKKSITSVIVEKKLLVDPIINIRHLNFEVTVIGEVGRPTVITVPSERISLLKALGLAGDITPYGEKNKVMLIREVKGKKKMVYLDLNDPAFLQSPYYYLFPNDVIYVRSDKNKLASIDRGRQILPSLIYSLSVIAVLVIDRLK